MGYQRNKLKLDFLEHKISSAETVLIGRSDEVFSSDYANIGSVIQSNSHASFFMPHAIRPSASSSALFPNSCTVRYPITINHLDRHVIYRNKTHFFATYHSGASNETYSDAQYGSQVNKRHAIFHHPEVGSGDSVDAHTEITPLFSYPEIKKVSTMPFLEKHGKKLTEVKSLAEQSP